MADETFWGGVAAWAWSQREEIVRSLKDIAVWFSGGDKQAGGRGIIILGAGGTGKTTLARIISGQYEAMFDSVEPYTESLGIEEFSLEDEPNVEIVVPPGQAHRREATWDDLLSSIARGDYRGVVLVSAFGYHSLGEIPAAYVTTTTTGIPGDQAANHGSEAAIGGQSAGLAPFLAEYVRGQQDDEIQILERVLASIGRCGRRTWLLSVVTKRDLWWPERTPVEYHYREGPYGGLVADFMSTINRRLFRHEQVFISLTINNFRTANGDLLRSNAPGYDHPLHYQSQRRLFETIKALRDWESAI